MVIFSIYIFSIETVRISSGYIIRRYHQGISSGDIIRRYHQGISSGDIIRGYPQEISIGDILRRYLQGISSGDIYRGYRYLLKYNLFLIFLDFYFLKCITTYFYIDSISNIYLKFMQNYSLYLDKIYKLKFKKYTTSYYLKI